MNDIYNCKNYCYVTGGETGLYDDGLIRNDGSDTLVSSIGNYKKLVPINIQLLPIGDVKFTIWATEHKQIAPTSRKQLRRW